jgi:WD40 repeat protein
MLVLKGHKNHVRRLAFSPDGNLLASAARQGHAISVWDTRRGTRLCFLSWHESVVTGLTFCPDGNLLASTDASSHSQLWEMPSGEPRFRSGHGAGFASRLVFTPDSKSYVAVAPGYEGSQRNPTWVSLAAATGTVLEPGYEVSRRDTATAALIDRMRSAHDYLYQAPIALAPDGRELAVAAHGALDVWNLAAKRIRLSLPQSSPVRAVAYAPDGRTLAFAALRRVTLWDTTTGEPGAVLKGHEKLVNAVAFTPDSRDLLTGSNDGTVRIWDAESGREVRAYDWHIGRVHVVAVAPDGMRAAAGGDAAIVLWDLDGLPG